MNGPADLTLVLPLDSRTDLTLRWLAWAERENLACPVILSHSGEDAAFAPVAAAVERGRAAGRPWTLLRFAPDSPQAPFHPRVAAMTEAVTTPFAAMAANDDFPLASGLTAAVAALRRDPAVAACSGPIAGLQPGRGDGFVWPANARAFGGGGRRGVRGGTPLERMTALLDTYDQLWYDAYRTDALRGSMTALRDSRVADPYLGELLQGVAVAAAGAVALTPACYIARQVDVPNSASSRIAAEKGDLLDEMLAPGWHAQFELFLARAVLLSGGADGAERALRAAYSRYARRVLAGSASFRSVSARGLALAGRALGAAKRRLGSRVSGATGEQREALERILSFLAEGAR